MRILRCLQEPVDTSTLGVMVVLDSFQQDMTFDHFHIAQKTLT